MGWVKLSIIVVVFCAVKCFAMSRNELEDFEDFLAKTSQLTPSLKHGTGDFDEHHVGDVISDNAWEESGKFEGDLILNDYQRKLLVQNVAQEQGLARNGVIDGAKRWPNNEVIFAIQVEHFSLDQVQAILNGIDDIARVSCVKFRPYRHGDPDAVVIQGNRKGCFSQVGYQGGYQALNLHSRHPVGLGCFRHGTVVHEMLHTLGFYHMQSSPDRDDYVDIIWDNILKSSKHNFRKYNMFAVSDFGVGYDYDSVLHYSGNAFSINGKPTIVPKQAGAQIGQRVGLSDKDTKKLNIMYCNSDLDNGQLIESSTEKSKKKKVKNKPFEGHGLGYHKGMTVAFKLSPEAETYRLADVPSSQGYDGFSKRPQILSLTAENENLSGDKKTKYSYKPPIPQLTGGYAEPVYYEKKPSKVNNNEVPPTDTSEAHGEQNPDITEALDRLTGIIKTHVYPSHTPDLRIYQIDNRYTEHRNHGKVGNEKALSAMEHMEHMDRMAKGETAKEAENLYDDFISKIATDGSYYSDPEEKKTKKLAITIPGYKDEHDKYLYKFNMDYLGENLYEKNFFLNRDEDKALINHDGWFQQFTPFQNNPSNDNRQRYLDRSKLHSKGDDRDDETVRIYY